MSIVRITLLIIINIAATVQLIDACSRKGKRPSVLVNTCYLIVILVIGHISGVAPWEGIFTVFPSSLTATVPKKCHNTPEVLGSWTTMYLYPGTCVAKMTEEEKSWLVSFPSLRHGVRKHFVVAPTCWITHADTP
jgi:hypothetical protein